MKPMGIALIGLGPGSQPHVASLAAMQDEIDMRWAVCRQPERAALGALAGRVKASSDLAEALDDPRVDVVIVATPAATHLEIARRCLAAGKHTLVEKPLEISLARAETLVTLAQESGRRFGVVLQHRFRPGAVRLRELLAEGALGEIQSGAVRVPWWRPQAGYYDQPGRGTMARDGGGVLLTQAIHAVDLFRSLAGVRSVDAAHVKTTSVHRIETEDYAAALLTLRNGAPGLLMATTASYPGSAEVIEINGMQGCATLEGGALKVSFHDGREVTVEAEGRSGSGANIMDFSPTAHRALITDFLLAVREERDPIVSGSDALATHRLIEAVLAKGAMSRN